MPPRCHTINADGRKNPSSKVRNPTLPKHANVPWTLEQISGAVRNATPTWNMLVGRLREKGSRIPWLKIMTGKTLHRVAARILAAVGDPERARRALETPAEASGMLKDM